MRLLLLALAAAGLAAVSWLIVDAGPATAVLSPAEIEAAKMVNRAVQIRDTMQDRIDGRDAGSGSYSITSARVDLDPDTQSIAPAAGAGDEAEDQTRRSPAKAQRMPSARTAEAEARAQKRAWTSSFFDR